MRASRDSAPTAVMRVIRSKNALPTLQDVSVPVACGDPPANLLGPSRSGKTFLIHTMVAPRPLPSWFR